MLDQALSTIAFSGFADPPSSMTSEFDAFPGTQLKQKYFIPEMEYLSNVYLVYKYIYLITKSIET